MDFRGSWRPFLMAVIIGWVGGFWGACVAFDSHDVFAGESQNSLATASSPRALSALCDPATAMPGSDRLDLLKRLVQTPTGRALIDSFQRKYGSLTRLVLQWDSVSYSKIMHEQTRTIASVAGSSGARREFVCVHLTRRLPEIEHLADLAHELTHATRLSLSVLRGDVSTVEEFVEQRLAATGGEADAFATECEVKREFQGDWDALCSPYVTAQLVSREKIVHDLKTGRLSASLTGETYPVLLRRQFEAMHRRDIAISRGASSRSGTSKSELENQ